MYPFRCSIYVINGRQRSCGKVMFSQVCVILFGGGVMPGPRSLLGGIGMFGPRLPGPGGGVYPRGRYAIVGGYARGVGRYKRGWVYVYPPTPADMGPVLPPLVLTPRVATTTRKVGKRAVRILLECFLVLKLWYDKSVTY